MCNISKNLVTVRTIDSKLKYSLLENLKKLQKTHTAVVFMVKSINKFLDPFLLLEFLFTIFLLILSYFVLATMLLQNNLQVEALLILFRAYSIILGILYLLKDCEDMVKPVSNSTCSIFILLLRFQG